MPSSEKRGDQIITPEASADRKEVKQICRFFVSRSGCRAGNGCRYVHELISTETDQSEEGPPGPKAAQVTPNENSSQAAARETTRRYQAPRVNESRVVARPVPKAQTEDPREFQIGQIRRRFNPQEPGSDGTIFHLKLTPSDPDFPFEIDELLCTLIVPLTYPTAGKPRIQVTNKELKRGFQLNIEHGFAELVTEFSDATLLGLFNRLDKQLEKLLSKEMAETMKIVRPRKDAVERPPSPPVPISLPIRTAPVHDTTPSFTVDQKLKAQGKRQLQLRQIVARLGRLKGFVEHTDGVTFTVPFQPLKKDSLPASMQNQSSVRLIVPELYDLVPPRIEFHGNTAVEARRIEHAFKQRVTTQADNALLAHVNYLSQNAHSMAAMHIPAEPEKEPTLPMEETLRKEEEIPPATAPNQYVGDESGKTHVHFIPRPPEWGASVEGDDWSSGESFASDEDEYSTGEDEEPAATATETTTSSVERGILISFPGLELYSVELLELVSLNITVKCDRCKEVTDVLRIRNNTAGDHTGMKDESCRKCANSLAVGYRMDLIHANSSRAGYLDMDGCTPVDMLPSNFIPTCSECSTPGPAPGIVAVRGDSAMAICRECHKKMTIKIPEIKFLRVSTAAIRASQAPLRRKPKENLGIVAGQELPQRGRCKHYAKSYRWFRFSCCQRVFPCDRCHNEASDHPEEHANRILCGHCSREQNYSPEQCHFCHNSFVAKRGQGFWEGGKGTRDRTKMSRKDPRKYKRRPATKPRGS